MTLHSHDLTEEETEVQVHVVYQDATPVHCQSGKWNLIPILKSQANLRSLKHLQIIKCGLLHTASVKIHPVPDVLVNISLFLQTV